MARPSDPLIDRDAASRAALEIIDEQGLQNFNLALVAAKLGVRTPSLYYHFADKSELLTEVARTILLDAQRPFKSRPENWIEAKLANAISIRRSVLKHPNATPLLLMYPARHIHLTEYEKGIRYLERHGVPAEYHMTIITGLEYLTFGSAFLAAAALSRHVREFAPHDPHLYPSLATAIKSNKLGEEAIFEETVRAFLEGFVARAERRGKAKATPGGKAKLNGRRLTTATAKSA
jgi:TetR/AcrR family transcriptional regulator, tetracycline repressor protein